MPEPIATWNRARGAWERPETNILCGHPALYSETWPTSGMTLGGRLYPLPRPERRTAASGSSSSPGLLPTPAAGNFNDGESLESWEARRQANLAKGINGNGQGTPLGVAVQLLPSPQEFDSHFDSLNISPEAAERQLHRTDGVRRNTTGSLTKDLLLLKTPTAQLAVNGGSQHPDKRRAGGHGPTLADQVEHQLLPTPAARDWKSGQSNIMDRNAMPLNEVVEMLLPTPTPTTTQRGPDANLEARKDAGPNLHNAVALLPTPWASDGTKGGPNQRGSSGDLMLPSAVMSLAPPAGALTPGGFSSTTPEGSAPGHAAGTAPTLSADGPADPGTTSRTTPTPPRSAPTLLPTPRTSDTGTPGRRASEGFRPPLSQVLLPTPTAMDSHGARNATANRSAVKRGTNNDEWTLSDVFWTGETTRPPSTGGKRSSAAPHPGQLSLDGLESA